ncbi:MAG: carboxypeptidase regulatory-like domain-containing protein, partial [Candidatus Atribacteria bacterium]|nr:carboxypeptidase regulatory-like domain-containing protein [Candidatus Atribacteria bacterium]
MNKKRLRFLFLSLIILVSFISGCIGGGQFGAPSTESSVTIKGVVVAPDNDCFTDTCSNPSIIEGEPLPNADIILKGNNGQTLTGKTDCAGNYQISGLTDDGYILYAHRGEVWIKKALSPVTGDGGEANYKTTAQVILWEVIENTNPGAIAINDIPTAISFDAIPQEFIDAVKAALADCRDAQQDPTCLALAKNIAVANFGAPCVPCVEGTPGSTPCICPTPTPDCPIGVAEAVISYEKIEGLTYRFDASDSKPQTGSYPILTYNWVISEGGNKNRGKNGSGIVCQSDKK